MLTKVCSKCKIEKSIEDFTRDSSKKDGRYSSCKKCKRLQDIDYSNRNIENRKEYNKEYRKNNINKLKEQEKKYRDSHKLERKEYIEENREKIKIQTREYDKEYRKKNKARIKENKKIYDNSIAKYATYFERLTIVESPISDPSGQLMVKCAHCEKYFYPTNLQIRNRIEALNGKVHGENRLYCSDNCKQLCPIYDQNKYPKGQNPNENYRDADVQRQWREMVLERDGHKCVKCGSTENLIAHHIEGVRWISMEAADIDMGVTLCKICERKAHSIEGCSYYDMQCK